MQLIFIGKAVSPARHDIVGPSGSGKTSLCNLVARFWDVESGRVSIGGSERLPLRGHHRK